jgi:acetylornithine/succinyldiaminopimelate/putrescine aminotransferase
VNALREAVSTSTAAIIAEPIQGEGGVRPLTPAFGVAIMDACRRTGALLIADEVQSGLGRTGVPFYFSTLGLKPHLVSLGKALGGGVPIGAALISDEVARTISFGDHGSTYGGNLLACRAALCVLEQLVEGGLIAQIERIGQRVEERLHAMVAAHPIVKEVRGAGLIWGLDLKRDATPVVPAALSRRVVVNRTAETVVRLLPPLVITSDEIDEGLERLDAALTVVEADGGGL